MSDYKPGKIVHIEHLKAAFKVIEATYKEVADLIDYFTNAKVGGAKKAVIRLLASKTAGMTRRGLANKINRYNAETVDIAIVELWLEGKLSAVNDKGDKKYGKKPEGFPSERYVATRLKHKDPDFDLTPAFNLSGGSEDTVSGWDASEEDSQDDEEESAGDLFSPEREWG